MTRPKWVPPRQESSGTPDGAASAAAPFAGRGTRAARVITVAVLAGYAANILIDGLWGQGRRRVWLPLVCVTGLFALQIVHSTKAAQSLSWRVRLLTQGAQAALTCLPLIWLPPWGSIGGFLAGSVLLLNPRRIRWWLYAVVGASVLPPALAWHVPAVTVVWLVESTLLTGLVVYCVSSLATMVVEAHAARDELARMAVMREQLRVAGELHGVLGRNLGEIAHSLELVASLLAGAPARAKEELGEILQVARKALADVRAAARDYRRMSLAAEAKTAVATLSSAGVDARVAISDRSLPSDADGLLANVLREVVAGLILLTRGERCLIEASVVDDVARLRVAVDEADVGLDVEHLRARVEAAGGRLSAGADGHDGFQLVADVPADGAASPPPEPVSPVPQPPMHLPPSSALGPRYFARRTAVAITLVVLSGYALVTAVFVLSAGVTGLGLAGFALCFVVIFSLQVAHSSGATVGRRAGVRTLLLLVQAVVTYVPLIWLGQQWGAMAGFLAAAVLLAVAEPWSWILYGAVAGSVALILWLDGLPLISIAYGAVFTLLTGLVLYGISSLQALVAEVHAARGPLVRMAVVQERLRIARDLHDLLSYSLSAISLKTELTHRLLPESVDRARQELTELQTITRRALIDAVHATRGDSDVSLDRDGESVRSTLSASGIDGSVEIACGSLPHEMEAVLAIVLREAATNILRHSKARNYLMKVIRDGAVVRLHVANDGALAEEETDRDSDGSGLQNLQTRVRGVGGTLTAGWDGDGWFHLWAVVPASVDDATPPPDRPASGAGDG